MSGITKRPLRIVHLFPELLNLYADQGNIAVLRSRANRRGHEVEIVPVRLGMPLSLADTDLILLGGGSDREQEVVSRELRNYVDELREAMEAGLPILAVCGGYQLLGKYYELPDGKQVAGLGLVDMVTQAGKGRLIGNIAISWEGEGAREGNTPKTIVGFENHGGRTHHMYQGLGRVLHGHGNNGKDQIEGLQYKGIIGTYIHGPLLPKNPHVADHLLLQALRYRNEEETLTPLDDRLEWQAHEQMLQRLGVKAKPAAN